MTPPPPTTRRPRRRVFLVGSGPLPAQDPSRMGFPALRTRQFLVALLQAGHEVALAALVDAAGEPEAGRTTAWRQVEQPTAAGPRTYHYNPVRHDQPGALLTLRDLRHEFAPDCVVSAGPFAPMAGGARAAGDEPLWVDVPGDPMSEAQLRALRAGDGHPIHHYRQVLSLAVTRGDRFSVISRPQRGVLVGALGLAGRLTARAAGRELVHVVRPSVEGLYRDCPPEAPQGLLAEIAPDDFAVLLCGGFNTWLDVDAITSGVLRAMDADPRIHLVATGGAVANHEENGFRRFRRAVEGSRHAGRFHLLGWVPARHLDAVFDACDLALSMDVPCYEAEFGSRTRLLDALERGLPVAATDTCELTGDLRRVEGFLPLGVGDDAQLAALLVRLSGEKRRRLASDPGTPRRRRAGIDADPTRVPWTEARGRYSIEATTAALVDWVDDPVRCREDLQVDFIEDQWVEIARLQERLEEVWSSPTWRYLGRVHRLVKGRRR